MVDIAHEAHDRNRCKVVLEKQKSTPRTELVYTRRVDKVVTLK